MSDHRADRHRRAATDPGPGTVLATPPGHEVLGWAIYHWGSVHQDRLLTTCLDPALRELERELGPVEVWFDRFDARGPHILALVRAPAPVADVLSRRLGRRLADHLESHPSTEVLPPEELASLHRLTRGKALCAPHVEPGLAPNNTLVAFRHPPDGYPYGLAAGLPARSRLWERVAELSRWSLAQLGDDPASRRIAAVQRFLAPVDSLLLADPERAQRFWRYHAGTLLLGLDTLDPEAVAARLPALLGPRNLASLLEAWRPLPDELAPILLALRRLLFRGGVAFAQAATLLREIIHTTLKQLGLTVPQHIPLVLFAWHRSRRLAAERTGRPPHSGAPR